MVTLNVADAAVRRLFVTVTLTANGPGFVGVPLNTPAV